MRRLGMKMPYRTVRAANHTSLSLPLACSILMEETGGGRNEFGHDPTIYAGAGTVTKTKYHAYKAARIHSGNKLMQGVGPVQLTYFAFQDMADEIGGCWRPLKNMLIGFEHLVESIRRDGLHAGVAAYNGSGPAAERYAAQVLSRAAEYAKVLRKPWPPR